MWIFTIINYLLIIKFLIKTNKDKIIAESNRELETFKKFQIAAQANPNLTYKEFCENINNK